MCQHQPLSKHDAGQARRQSSPQQLRHGLQRCDAAGLPGDTPTGRQHLLAELPRLPLYGADPGVPTSQRARPPTPTGRPGGVCSGPILSRRDRTAGATTRTSWTTSTSSTSSTRRYKSSPSPIARQPACQSSAARPGRPDPDSRHIRHRRRRRAEQRRLRLPVASRRHGNQRGYGFDLHPHRCRAGQGNHGNCVFQR